MQKSRKNRNVESYNLKQIIEIIKTTEGLPDNLTTEVQLWDEIFKKQAFAMPELFFPLIKEVHGKEYAVGTKVKPLASEFIIERALNKKLQTIRADVTLIVGEFDIYHFECQITNDGTMTLRMIDYDMQIALTYSTYDKDGNLDIVFPSSAILYIQNGTKISPELKCNMHFQDGSSHEYVIPAIKVQAFTLEEIKEKHLAVLIPFMPLGFRGKKSDKEDVSTFFKEIIVLLDEEVMAGYLSENNRQMIIELLGKSMIRVFYKDDNLIQEVVEMTAPILKLDSEILREKVTEEVTKEVTRSMYINTVQSLMNNKSMSLDEAMDALSVPDNMKKEIRKAIN